MVLANATISYGTHYTPTIQEEIVESSRMQLQLYSSLVTIPEATTTNLE